MSRKNRYVAIEGPIGVGKTTLAKRLAQSFAATLLLEGADENPFLARFYASPERFALPTQLFFLMQRAEQLSEIRQPDLFAETRVADFMLDKDRLFAELTLNAEEFALYDQVHQHVVREYPEPDVVIYLQAPVTTLKERILQRGIEYEGNIDLEYLQRLAERYTVYFRDYHRTPLLVVDALQTDLVNNSSHYSQLLEMIEDIGPGHHFLSTAAW